MPPRKAAVLGRSDVGARALESMTLVSNPEATQGGKDEDRRTVHQQHHPVHLEVLYWVEAETRLQL